MDDTKAAINTMKILKSWVIPIIIIVGAFALLPDMFTTWFGPALGPTLGQWTGYVVSAMVAAIALWLTRYTEKHI